MTTETIQKKSKISIDAIAEQWVNLVLVQVQAKKLPHKELIKIKTKYEHA